MKCYITQCNLMQYNVMWYNVMQFNIIQCNTTQRNTIQCNEMKCTVMQNNAIQCIVFVPIFFLISWSHTVTILLSTMLETFIWYCSFFFEYMWWHPCQTTVMQCLSSCLQQDFLKGIIFCKKTTPPLLPLFIPFKMNFSCLFWHEKNQ